jgi:hypothetical protein
MAADKHAFLKNGSDLFLRGALERGDHVEVVRENRVLAQMIFRRLAPLANDALIKIDQVICPTGRREADQSPLSSWRKPGPITTGLYNRANWSTRCAQKHLFGVMGPGFRQDDSFVPTAHSFLLPLWEKVVRTKSATDEGSLSAGAKSS